MRVAGLGFRSGASLATLRAVLALAGGVRLDALASSERKAAVPALQALAAEVGLPLHAVSPDDLARQNTVTHSSRVHAVTGTGSLCEAAALAVAGRGASLVQARLISEDGMATVAIAEGEGP